MRWVIIKNASSNTFAGDLYGKSELVADVDDVAPVQSRLGQIGRNVESERGTADCVRVADGRQPAAGDVTTAGHQRRAATSRSLGAELAQLDERDVDADDDARTVVGDGDRDADVVAEPVRGPVDHGEVDAQLTRRADERRRGEQPPTEPDRDRSDLAGARRRPRRRSTDDQRLRVAGDVPHRGGESRRRRGSVDEVEAGAQRVRDGAVLAAERRRQRARQLERDREPVLAGRQQLVEPGAEQDVVPVVDVQLARLVPPTGRGRRASAGRRSASGHVTMAAVGLPRHGRLTAQLDGDGGRTQRRRQHQDHVGPQFISRLILTTIVVVIIIISTGVVRLQGDVELQHRWRRQLAGQQLHSSRVRLIVSRLYLAAHYNDNLYHAPYGIFGCV